MRRGARRDARRLPAALALLCIALDGPAHADDVRAAVRSADDAYLDALVGRWDMTGTVHGKPVRYRATGERVLDGGFLRLHMLDTAPHPAYVADVFLGYDPTKRDFIVHWLDRFGAAGARVVATGVRDGDRLVVIFPYEEGAFRDTFTRDGARREWQFLLESQEPGGAWSNFATFSLHRAAAARHPTKPAAGGEPRPATPAGGP